MPAHRPGDSHSGPILRAELACSMHSFNENNMPIVAAVDFLPTFYAAHCRMAGPVRAKYGSDSEFFDLDVSKFPLPCVQTWLHLPSVLSCVHVGDVLLQRMALSALHLFAALQHGVVDMKVECF